MTSKDNDTADALSRLDITDNTGFDKLECEPPNKPLTSTNDKEKFLQLLSPMIEEENQE